jgi:hypothetical protein
MTNDNEPKAPTVAEFERMSPEEQAAIARQFHDWREQGGKHHKGPDVTANIKPVIPKRDIAAARWDPECPLKYRYEKGKVYDPADYLAFKLARTEYLKTHTPGPIARDPLPDQKTRQQMRDGLDYSIAESRARGHTGPARFRDLEITSELRGGTVVVKTPWYARFFTPGK